MPPDSDASAAAAPPADGLERAQSRRARAASALRSGTVAAAAAIASVTPHGTGAIDVVMVRDADGATRSSPFYVRFGKYTGARSADRRVAVEVNGKDAGFCMHLGRTGEAWFLAQDEHDWDDRAILSGGAASPLGYSSGDEPSAPPATALGAQPPRAVVGSAPTRSGEDARAAAAAAASPPPVASRPPRTASSSSLGKPPRAPPPPPAPPRSAAASDDDPGLLGGVLSPDPAPRSPLGEAVDGKEGGGASRPGGASPSPQPRSPSPSPRPPSDQDDSSSSSSDDDESDNDDAAPNTAAASPPPAAAAAATRPPPRAGPTVDLALVPPADIVGAPPDAVRAALDAGALTAADWRERGHELAAHPHLVAVVGGAAVHRWADAAPALAGGLAYGGDWAPMLPPPLALAAPALVRADSGSADGGDRAESRLASLRGWLASFRGPGGGGPWPPPPTGSVRRPSPLLAPDAARDEALASALARAERHRRHRRSFLPTPAQLAALPVSRGRNTVDFVYGRERLRAYIYVLDPRARVVVSDIDGTVTRSDMLGHVLPRVGVDWSHGGIARLFTDVAANGYSLLYLSSRSIAQASATRDYLHSVDQGGDRLPAGPVLMSPDGLVPSLYRELILRRPHEFKIRCLEDVRALFPPGAAPFHAGFGNRDTDEVSYLAVGIPPPRTFIINPRGELRRSSGGVVTSGTSTLAAVHAIVHDVFPPLPAAKPSAIARSGSAPPVPLSATAAAAVPPALPDRGDDEAFNAFNYFRIPPPIVVDSDGEEFCDPEGKA